MANNVEIDLDEATEGIDASLDKIKMKLDNGAEWSSEDIMNAHT